MGLQDAYIMCRCSGGRTDEAQNALHARFAAACALSDLLSEQPVQQVIAKWGQEKALTQQGAACADAGFEGLLHACDARQCVHQCSPGPHCPAARRDLPSWLMWHVNRLQQHSDSCSAC